MPGPIQSQHLPSTHQHCTSAARGVRRRRRLSPTPSLRLKDLRGCTRRRLLHDGVKGSCNDNVARVVSLVKALPEAILIEVVRWLGPGYFAMVGLSCRSMYRAYQLSRISFTTALVNATSTATCWSYTLRLGQCPSSSWQVVGQWAARRGRLDVLKAARHRGFDWICDGSELEALETTVGEEEASDFWFLGDVAASLGHLDILRWALKEGCPRGSYTCVRAASAGHLPVLKWMLSHEYEWIVDCFFWAAHYGHLHILKWLASQGYEWHPETCAAAASTDRIDILNWLISFGCPCDALACAAAARSGNLRVLSFLRSRDIPWDENTCAGAARFGHLSVLQWARAEGCPWDELTCSNAAMNGHLEVLRWARANGCSWTEEVYALAREFGHDQIAAWAVENDCPRFEEDDFLHEQELEGLYLRSYHTSTAETVPVGQSPHF